MGQVVERGVALARPPRLLTPSLLLLSLAALAASAETATSASDFDLRVLEPADAWGEELQLSAGQSLRVRCEGPGRLRWRYPQPDETEVVEAPAPDVHEEQAGAGRWASTLHLPNASYFHTGLYGCELAAAPEDADGRPRPPPASVYVFVADPEYPWVRGGVVAAWAMQYEDATLDCRPNNRSIRVRLLDSTQREIPLGLNEDLGWTLQWAPTLGFSLGPVNDREADVYFCRADDWDSMDLMLMLTVMPRSTNLPPPTIDALAAIPHAVLRRSMELRCSVRVTGHVFFHMEWILPANSTVEADGRLNVTTLAVHFNPLLQGRIGTTNLTIVNITETDAGLYTCQVTDHTRRIQNASFYLNVRNE